MRQLRYIFLILALCLSSTIVAADLKKIEQNIGDSVITTKILAKFAKNKNLNVLKISVLTEKGNVKLQGHVKNKQAFVDALRLAKSTKGVKHVNTDRLDIKLVNSALTDAYITAKIEAAVLKAKVLEDESIPLVGINATTHNGVVQLSGKVKSKKARDAIVKRAKTVKGVKKVLCNLQVTS